MSQKTSENLLIEMVDQLRELTYQTRVCALYKFLEELGIQELTICVEPNDSFDEYDTFEYVVKFINKKINFKAKYDLSERIKSFLTNINFDWVVEEGSCEHFSITKFASHKEQWAEAKKAYQMLVDMMGIS